VQDFIITGKTHGQTVIKKDNQGTGRGRGGQQRYTMSGVQANDDEQMTVIRVIREIRQGWKVIMTEGLLGNVVLIFRGEGSSETRGWHEWAFSDKGYLHGKNKVNNTK